MSSETHLPRETIVERLRALGEPAHADRVCYYDTLDEMVGKARSSRHWSEGEIFAWAESPERYVVFRQVAPDSCEMFAITERGYLDTFTAYRFSSAELMARLGHPMDPHERLEAAVKKAAQFLIVMEQHRRDTKVDGEAVRVAAAMRTVLYAVLQSDGQENQTPLDRQVQVESVSHLCAPQGNGLGDCVIWSALVREGNHRDADAWTAIANEIRAARLVIQAARDAEPGALHTTLHERAEPARVAAPRG